MKEPLYLIGSEGECGCGLPHKVMKVSGGWRETIPFESKEHAFKCKGKNKNIKVFKLVEVK